MGNFFPFSNAVVIDWAFLVSSSFLFFISFQVIVVHFSMSAFQMADEIWCVKMLGCSTSSWNVTGTCLTNCMSLIFLRDSEILSHDRHFLSLLFINKPHVHVELTSSCLRRVQPVAVKGGIFSSLPPVACSPKRQVRPQITNTTFSQRKMYMTQQINIGHCHWWMSSYFPIGRWQSTTRISAYADVHPIKRCIPTLHLIWYLN